VCVESRYQGRIQEFWKGGPVREQSPEPSAEVASAGGGLGASPENFEKLDAISCNLAYIFGIRMASDIIQNWAFAVAATILKPTDIRCKKRLICRVGLWDHTDTHAHTLPKTPRISATIKSKFNFKSIFSDIVYNVKKQN